MSVSNSISKLVRSWPWSVSLNSLKLGLQLRLWTFSITASQCISILNRSWPPTVSLCSLNLGLQVRLQLRSIMASKYIMKEQWWVWADTGVTEVDWATWSIYSRDPWADRHHLIFISSRHTMKIHTQFFPTFKLTRSVWDFMDPHDQVVSNLLTFFLRSSSYNPSPSQLLFVCCDRCGEMLMVGSLPSSSLISPQRPPSGLSLGSLNRCLQVLLWLCSTSICGQIDHMYIYRDS